MISQKARYALRAVVALAKPYGTDELLVISEIAKRERIPKKFLEQILLDLKHRGIVDSRRGKAGGYFLSRSPSDITFGEILRIIDGPIALLSCLSIVAYRRCEDCADEASCEVRRVFAKVAETSRSVLDNTSIEDAITGQGKQVVRLIAS